MKTTLGFSIACSVVLILLLVLPVSPYGMMTWSVAKGMMGRSAAIMSVPSPDGHYIAYVEESPSLDPPNQTLLVQRSDKSKFLPIAKLAEDVDCIQEITWSPDSEFVLFRSNDYLTATRVSDWKTVRIYLGQEWVRSKPAEFSTFAAPSPREVQQLAFPGKGTFTYRLKGEPEPHLVSF